MPIPPIKYASSTPPVSVSELEEMGRSKLYNTGCSIYDWSVRHPGKLPEDFRRGLRAALNMIDGKDSIASRQAGEHRNAKAPR